MDTRHLEAVLAVAQHRSFTAAAAALYMAQSTLSRQIAILERDLGVKLFHRGPGPATPTEYGGKFIKAASEVLDAAAAARATCTPAEPSRC